MTAGRAVHPNIRPLPVVRVDDEEGIAFPVDAVNDLSDRPRTVHLWAADVGNVFVPAIGMRPNNTGDAYSAHGVDTHKVSNGNLLRNSGIRLASRL
jgi:hypothetical protein